jgi:RNA polymerase sigma factor (sigma-70 family)
MPLTSGRSVALEINSRSTCPAGTETTSTPRHASWHASPTFPRPVLPAVSVPLPSDSRVAPDHSRWFSDEVHVHESSLRTYLRGAFPAVRDVDDVVQESYLRLWRARPSRHIVCARAFLFRVARNVALTLLRRERSTPVFFVKDLSALTVVETGRSAASAACLDEELVLLAEAIDALPARCREIVILRRIEHLSHREIAARLGIAEETVEVQVARGVKRCGAYLRRRGVRFEYEPRA